jgi:hypothetical protein
MAAIDPRQRRVVAGFNADLELHDVFAGEHRQIVEYLIRKTVGAGADGQPADLRMG